VDRQGLQELRVAVQREGFAESAGMAVEDAELPAELEYHEIRR
jgi:hypothetical protein